MSDMQEALTLFDLKMTEAVNVAEDHLRTSGASEAEIYAWQNMFLPIWRVFVKENRLKIVKHFTEYPSHSSH